MIDGNRLLNGAKIKRIISDIANGIDLLRYCPILVIERNDRLEIIDGQHRFFVARKIKSKVWYIIAEELSLYDIARMNSNTEKWKAEDYINCYSSLGNKNYEILGDFMRRFSLSSSTAINILYTGKIQSGGGESSSKMFHEGKFEVRHLQHAERFMKTANEFAFSGKSKRGFLRAVEKIIHGKKIEVSDLIAKVNADGVELKHMETEKEFLFGLESIYNKGKHNRVIIY